MSNFWKNRWEDVRPNLIWAGLCLIFGGGMTAIVAGIQAVGNRPLTVTAAALIFSLSFVALVILFLIVRKRKGQPIVPTQMLIYLPVLAGAAMLVWAYFVGTAVSRLNDDVRHLKIQMVRFVLPRQLDQSQMDSFGRYLSQFDRRQVVLEVVSRDEEAANFASDVEQALQKGGWAVSDHKYPDDVSAGVSLSMIGSTSSPTGGSDSSIDKPAPLEILEEAFKRAGVQIGGKSGSDSNSAAKATITISIGRRRRDRWAVLPPNYIEGFRRPIRPVTDDDFDIH